MNDRRRRLCWSTAKAATVALALAVMAAPAQAAPQPPQPPRPLKGGPRADWTGVWVIPGSFLDTQDGSSVSAPNGRANSGIELISIGAPKLKPEALKRAKVYSDAAAEGRPLAGVQCRPRGIPFFWYGPYAWEMIQSRGQLNLYQESGGVRRVYLDGRKHPSLDDVDPLFQGHSVGHWEGDDLVVDTVNINPEIFISGPGTNHTEKSHITERFRPIGDDRIDVEVTVSNPDVLEEPWTFVRRLKRKPDMEILDYDCEENNRNPPGPDGREQAILPPQK